MHSRTPISALSKLIHRNLRPARTWRGEIALVPVDVCYRLLDITLWLVGPAVALAFAMIFARLPGRVSVGPLFYLGVFLNVLVLLAAICRGWPFMLRFALLAIELFSLTTFVSAAAGITPNWVFLVGLLVALTTLFLGARAGIIVVSAILLSHMFIAWAWVQGYLPTYGPSIRIPTGYLDFSSTAVWARVLTLTAVLLVTLVVNLRLLVRALKQSDVFKQAILDSMNAHIAVLDQHGMIIAVNKPWLRFADENSPKNGAARPRIGVGENYLEVCRQSTGIGSSHAMSVRDGILAVLEGRSKTFIHEYRCDGPEKKRWFSMTVMPMEEGSRHAIVSHTDISERKEAETAFRYQEMLLRDMGRIAHVGGWEFDPVSGKGAWTEEVARIHDFDPDTPIDMAGGINFIAPSSRPKIIEAIRQAIEQAQSYDLELELISAKNVHKWVRTIGHPVMENGKVVRVHGSFQDITILKRAQEALQASESEFRAMFEKGSIGMVQANPHTGQLLRVNQKMTEITGYDAEELLTLRFPDITHPDDQARDWESFQRAVRGEIPVHHLEKRYIRKDRSIVWVNVNATMIRDSSGQLVRATATVEDITERKRTENELREYRARLDAALSSMTDAVYISDANGRFIDFNDAFATFHRFKSKDECAQSLTHNPSIIEVYMDHGGEPISLDMWAVPRALRGETATNAVYKLRRQDTGETWIASYSFSPIRNKEGGIVGSVVVGRDITDRKMAEAALRERTAFFEAQVESTPDAILVADDNARKLLQNRQLIKLFKIPEDMVADMDDTRLVRHIVQQTKHPEKFSERMAHLYAHQDEIGQDEIELADGRVLERYSAPVRDPMGKYYGRIWTFRDITERRQLELQFLRTQRLEALGTLSSGIAHDLNNILAPMLMATSALGESIKDAKDRELMMLIEKSARRGADIIRQLLTFSRGVEGQRVRVQLRHLVKEMAGIARETFPRNIHLAEIGEREVWPIVADPTQMHQVLMNLCVNARDAMPEGGELRISIKNVQLDSADAQLGAEARPGPYVLLSVEDTGEGIRPELLDQIFDPFFTTKSIGKGTGLGLSTVLGIIRSHGGFIKVYSELGRGSNFNIYLPANRLGDDAIEQRTEEIPRGQGETVLVVDDEDSIIKVARHCLEKHGYRVLTARDGREALIVFVSHQHEIKLVVTDVMMPIMDGLKLARALRGLNPKVRVIASSGLDQEEKTAELAAGYIVDFLSKPYEKNVLLRAVHQHVEKAHS